MGKYDSSATRVAPVFDALVSRDATGASWLDALLRLANRPESCVLIPANARLVSGHGRRWGTDERKLSAPEGLLEYLARNIDPTRVQQRTGGADAHKKRMELAQKRPDAVADAVRALRAGRRGRQWFVLEGPSRPDALLEADDFVVCVEGKRTERICTTKTTWMPIRSQLLRHMDAAVDAFPTKSVFGLLIVEGHEPDPLVPSPHWISQCAEQNAPKMVTGSLPHRSVAECSKIAHGVLGVVTWQAVCDRFGILWPPCQDAV